MSARTFGLDKSADRLARLRPRNGAPLIYPTQDTLVEANYV